MLHVKKITETYWKVLLDNPPINLFDDQMVLDLQDLLNDLLARQVNVVVFESSDPDFFIPHKDLTQTGGDHLGTGPTGMAAWPDFTLRIEKAPFLTIGVLRGRARGVGSEFLQALDIRFASKERAILSQIELGCAVIPGGGGMERLPKLVGRSRAMEIIMGSRDFDADTAALYGWVNRSIPDADLDKFVDDFALRIAGYDHQLVATCKKLINERSGLIGQQDFAESRKAFFDLLTFPSTRKRIKELFKKGLQQKDFEMNIQDFLD
jgi:enoyl-CoA hydratase/carnithine racemase